MSNIAKYDRTFDPQEHLFFFTIIMNRNDLTMKKDNSMMIKKFGKPYWEKLLYSLLFEIIFIPLTYW